MANAEHANVGRRCPPIRWNALTFHSLSTRDNLRVFMVAVCGLSAIDKSERGAMWEQEGKVNNDRVINRHISSQ